MFRRDAVQPFARTSAGKIPIVAIFVTFALVSAATVLLSVSATKGSQHRTSVIQVAARQRTLAERYAEEVLLVRAGRQADPAYTAGVLAASAAALLEGGTVPGVNGDDDETKIPAASDRVLRAQFVQEQHLIGDLTATGEALLAHSPTAALPQTAHEHVAQLDPIQRLRVLSALASSVAFRAGRELGHADESNINNLLTNQIVLGVAGLLITLLLASALLLTARRQTAHFRSLALSSSDLVLVLGGRGCRYASRSVEELVGHTDNDLFGRAIYRFVHDDDRAALEGVSASGRPGELTFRMRNVAGEWRHLEARVTDLRGDRNLRGVVLHARDTTDRVRLERQLTVQMQRDSFTSRLGEALEMADEENEVFEVIERAAVEISERTPMELLLSDSSRANVSRVASNHRTEAPGCPVKSPYSCVAVRRGRAVTFESSETLNACPYLRERPSGPCSAVCVPVSFMGRALGVLHTTGADGSPLDDDAVSQLTLLAGQAGARIGTVRAFEKTQLQASTDGLTGLVNRRTAEKRLRDLIRTGRRFALAIADLDRFKQLNDRHGHEAGDRALRLFSQVATATLRDEDVIARWGGEEFVIVLPGLDRFQAMAVLDRLRHNLALGHPGETPRFTASFGVTDSGEADTLEDLFSVADGGLYAAKQAGRDRATIGDPESATKAARDRAARRTHLAGDDEDDARHADSGSVAAASKGNGGGGRSHVSMHELAYEEEPDPPSTGVHIR
jgi:diguanylate cyclase (GGDEF)-like protein/PAS domain S-box-containing protein